MDGEHNETDFEVASIMDRNFRKPMETNQGWGDVVSGTKSHGETSSSVLEAL
jgi:hypothetical protein